MAAARAGGNPVRIELGPPEPVLADRELGPRYFPDGALALVRTKPDCRFIVAAGVSSFLLERPEMGRFAKAARILEPGRPGEFDNGYAGISGVFAEPKGDYLYVYYTSKERTDGRADPPDLEIPGRRGDRTRSGLASHLHSER